MEVADTRLRVQTKLLKNARFNEFGLIYTVFCVWAYILICRPQDLLTFVNPARPGLIVFMLIVICCLLNNPFKGLLPLCKEVQVRQYLLLFLVMAVSVLFSYYRHASFNFVIFSYSQVVLFFLIFILVVNDLKQLESFIFMCCCGIGLYSLGYLLKGVYVVNRISYGEMYDPNDMAYVAISFIMFNFYFWEKSAPVYRLVAAAANVLACLILVLSTGSRGGFVAGLIVSAMLLLSRRTVIASSVKVLLVLSVVLFMGTSERDFSRYNTLFNLKDDYNVNDEEGRIQIWQTGAKLMLSHPLAGVGVACFPEALGTEREAKGAVTGKWQTAHNSMILIGAETGVIGLLLFVILNFRTFRIFNNIRKVSLDNRLMRLSELAFIGFTGNFVAAMFISQSYSIIWVFYIALSVVLARLSARMATAPAVSNL